MQVDVLALAAIAAGIITLWQPRHFRITVGIYLLFVGVVGLGAIRL